jgi:DNA-directed RNA polymerase subunit RPC12/RpoP
MSIRNLRCLRCGYTHVTEIEGKLPSRCPVCKSTRLIRIFTKKHREDKYNLSINEIYNFLNIISGTQVLDQEKIRKKLRESAGIHILCINYQKEQKKKILTTDEAELYFSLIKNESFGLAIIHNSIVAISPNSPIRSHVGVNISLLKELKDIL